MNTITDKAPLYRALMQEGTPLLAEELRQFPSKKGDPWLADLLTQIRQQGEAFLETEAPHLSFQLFRRFWEDGDRYLFENPYFERRGRLLTFSLLCWLEPEDDRWLHALEDILWLICSEPFWCLPAHFTSMEHKPLPFEEYADQLDLFSAETGFAIAEALALCEERLAPRVVQQAQIQLEKRIFAPFLDGSRAFKFEVMRNNWAAVCGGAIGGAAIYRLQDVHKLSSILHRCLSCMQVYLDGFGPDGVCEEGVSYWNYGFGFFVCFADLLRKRTGGKIDLFADEKVEAISKSQAVFYLSGCNTISFSDGSACSHFRMGLSCYLQNRFPEAVIPEKQYAQSPLSDHCYRYCLALRDLLWYNPAARFGCPEQSAAWLENAQWLISRTSRFQLAAKAGHNGESHNHNDVGSFQLQKQGVPLLCDLGAGLYNAKYFSSQRYEVFVNASRSHNLPLINGAEQQAGLSFSSSQVTAQLGAVDSLSMELSGCYKLQELQSFHREIRHNREEGCVTVLDRFVFTQPGQVTESFVSGTPIRLEEGAAVFSCDGTELRLAVPEGAKAVLLEEQYLGHREERKTAYLLHLEFEPAKELELELCFR